MKIKKIITTTTGVLAAIYYLIVIVSNIGKLKGIFEMFTSVPALLWGVLLSMLFIWFLNYDTRKDVQKNFTEKIGSIKDQLDAFNKNVQVNVKEINTRLDNFNGTIELAGSQHQESIDNLTKELREILKKKLPDANTTSK